MRRLGVVFVVVSSVQSLFAALPIPGDAARGAELFESLKCVSCHAVNGQGGKAASDLGRVRAREFTPASLAALMWNHAPAMWAAIERSGVRRPGLTEDQAADLFAFFYSVRYFERPGDAGRGKQQFTARRCAACHDVGQAGSAVRQSAASGDAIEFAAALWNHSAAMEQAMAQKRFAWPTLTAENLNDMVVYLGNLPGAARGPRKFAAGSAETGQYLFQVKGCANCHQGATALDRRRSGRTLADFAAALWNHAPRMRQRSELSGTEMRRLVGYLWSIQYFEEAGDARRGRRVFEARACGSSCHGASAPPIAGRKRHSFSMLSMLWTHGPQMLEATRKRGVDWPRFDGRQMSDLIAYLNEPK